MEQILFKIGERKILLQEKQSVRSEADIARGGHNVSGGVCAAYKRDLLSEQLKEEFKMYELV